MSRNSQLFVGLNKHKDEILIQWKMVYFINIADIIDYSFGRSCHRIAHYPIFP